MAVAPNPKDMRQPLLNPESKVDPTTAAAAAPEVPAKPPPPANKPADKPGPSLLTTIMSSPHFTIAKRTMLLFSGMAIATYCGVAASCQTLEWPLGLGCSSNGISCSSTSWCQKHVANTATCYAGNCVDDSDDLHPICTGKCTPVQINTITDILFVVVMLTIYWCVGEYLIRRFDMELKADIQEGERWQKKLDEKDGIDRKKNIQQVRHSWQWNEELKGWRERKAKAKQRFSHNVSIRAYLFYGLYVVIMFLMVFMIVGVISPKHPQATPYPEWTLDYVLWQLESIGSFEWDAFYFWIVLIQFILEAGLFFGAIFTVTWPQPALVRSGDLKFKPAVNRAKAIVQPTELIADENPGLIQDTCLLIACHQSCLTKDMKRTFTNTIRTAMKIFPPSAVFVCDNGPWDQPRDRTIEVCRQLSLEVDPTGADQINYVFIPEGNKTHAMYWTTEYWIPELVRHQKSVDFTYGIIIDDDVPLPPDLHVPLLTLSRQEEIKSVSYVICAATENGDFNSLVAMQDAEYKLAGLMKQFQWQFGSTMACHGAIGLWRRDVLGKKILWDHDTVFHGEDLYMGLLLHRMRKNYAIMVSAGAVVPTFAPENMLILFRQRVTSWDLCAQRKFLTYLRELVGGWCNTRTYVLKPFLLQEVINIILDWTRIFLMASLAHRNLTVLMLCFLVFYFLLYVEIVLFNNVVLRDRPELKLTLGTVLMFPFYRTWCLIFRLYSLLRNVIMYSTWVRKFIRISEREQDMHDIPPVPYITNPDWFTIWHASTVEEDNDELVNMTRKLCSRVSFEDATERERFRLVSEAALMYCKMLRENSMLGFPGVLSLHSRSTTEADRLGVIMESLRQGFERKLGELCRSSQWPEFDRRFGIALKKWAESDSHLFYDRNFQGSGLQHLQHILKSNVYVLGCIEEIVGRTRWPAAHDRVADLKQVISTLISVLREKVENLEDSMDTQNMRHMAPAETLPASDAMQRQMMTPINQRLSFVKSVIERGEVAAFAQARQTLNEIRGALMGVNQRQQWVIDVLASVSRLEQALDARSRPGAAVQVQASLNPGARMPPGGGTGLAGQQWGQPTGNPYRAPVPTNPSRK